MYAFPPQGGVLISLVLRLCALYTAICSYDMRMLETSILQAPFHVGASEYPPTLHNKLEGEENRSSYTHTSSKCMGPTSVLLQLCAEVALHRHKVFQGAQALNGNLHHIPRLEEPRGVSLVPSTKQTGHRAPAMLATCIQTGRALPPTQCKATSEHTTWRSAHACEHVQLERCVCLSAGARVRGHMLGDRGARKGHQHTPNARGCPRQDHSARLQGHALRNNNTR